MKARWVPIVLASTLGGALGLAIAPAASAVAVPISFDFGVVMPGETDSQIQTHSLPVASIVTESGWAKQNGTGIWSAEICSSAAVCHDLNDLQGSIVPAGDYTIAVTVTMPSDAPQGIGASASGMIRFTETTIALPLTGEHGLALTGSAVPPLAATIGALALGTGAFLILAARRRRTSEKPPEGNA